MRVSRVSIVGVLVAVSLAVTGCGVSDTEPTPVPTETTTTPSPSPTSTPELTPETRPELGDLVLTTSGLGPLKLGTDPSTLDPQTSIVELIPGSACEGGTAERWAAAYAERPLGNELRAFEVGRPLPGEPIVAMQIFDPHIRTSAGLSPGMTIEQLSTMYPDAEVVASGAGRDQFRLEQDSAGELVADVWQEGTETPGVVISLSIGLFGPPSFHSLGSC